MKIRLNNYKKELDAIDAELLTLPMGRLVKRGKFYWQAIKEKEIGITNNTELIQLFCRKRYLLERKKQLKINILIISGCMSRFDNTTQEDLILSLPDAYQGLPDAYFFDHISIKAWREDSYRKNTYLNDSLNYFSKNGISVRSKSEALIANLLEEYGIPYRYDAELTLGRKIIYPDFIIKNPCNGKIIVWEHFGALDQPGYEQKMDEKMKFYLKHDYKPFDTLIYTFEFDVMNAHRLKDLVINIIKLD